ncbi:hypothetical protein GCM10009801_82140 [Streptomyces albiaxialis]|uniref:Uncharacterized protein n=1 Tax=Streptomyces albiaxialis TaxID=329523 RepID=A0ABN2X777_9ACTN
MEGVAEELTNKIREVLDSYVEQVEDLDEIDTDDLAEQLAMRVESFYGM